MDLGASLGGLAHDAGGDDGHDCHNHYDVFDDQRNDEIDGVEDHRYFTLINFCLFGDTSFNSRLQNMELKLT